MDEFQTDMMITSYEYLENNLHGFFKTVPYHKKNEKTWSPLLADILVGSCSLLDSLFRMSMPPRYNKRIRKTFEMNDYCSKFGAELKSLRSLVYVSPPILVSPYENWSQHYCPSWWNDYNTVKHDRLKYMALATVDATMLALCALFEAITQNQAMAKALIRHDWIDTAGYNIDWVLPKLCNRQNVNGITNLNITFLVQSKLFVSTLGKKPLPDDVKKIKPVDYTGGKRLIAYLGKWSGD